MDVEQVLIEGEQGKVCERCEIADSNCKARQQLDQADLDLLAESIQRIKIVGKMLWEFESVDDIERGTVAVMLSREADHIFEVMASLETRLGI